MIVIELVVVAQIFYMVGKLRIVSLFCTVTRLSQSTIAIYIMDIVKNVFYAFVR